jgi:hypothetical protein
MNSSSLGTKIDADSNLSQSKSPHWAITLVWHISEQTLLLHVPPAPTLSYKKFLIHPLLSGHRTAVGRMNVKSSHKTQRCLWLHRLCTKSSLENWISTYKRLNLDPYLPTCTNSVQSGSKTLK